MIDNDLSNRHITKQYFSEKRIYNGEHWRISFLTSALVRLEWSESGHFEDSLTQVVRNRKFHNEESKSISIRYRGDWLTFETSNLRLTYNGEKFSKENLSIVIKGVSSIANTWHFGDAPTGNLGGTARTLDQIDGATRLGEGILSRDGWSVLDDSDSSIVPLSSTTDYRIDGNLISPREYDETDIYFFGYGHLYFDAMRDYYRLTGGTPLLPRFALGNWWSRYYKYSAEDYLQLMRRFQDKGIPFDVAVMDMDWHTTEIDAKYGSGWTGYSWNRELFPSPHAFMSELHEMGMKVTLNVHPRDGIRAFEDDYLSMAERLGVDSANGEPIEFDLTDQAFTHEYFELHQRLERQGVDFWWIDWQQGSVSRVPGVDPLWLLNYLHWLDSGRSSKWPLIFSRYAGPGSHRYPIGFSGDTVMSWDSLQFQPYFTSTASNIGYGWWSHDIGGHMLGYRNEDLEARWYQLGTFSPINRLHSTASEFMGKEPWNFNEPSRSSMVYSLRLRHRLVPYLYSMNYRAHWEGIPLVIPMYWSNSESEEAYEVPTEFYFGTELVVSPIVSPIDRSVQRGMAQVWLPCGLWFDFFDGRKYEVTKEEGRKLAIWRDSSRIPAFCEAGSIVPLSSDYMQGIMQNPTELTVIAFPGKNGKFILLEDDGVYKKHENVESGNIAETELRLDWNERRFSVMGARGDLSCLPAFRNWKIILRGVELETGSPANSDYGYIYNKETLSLEITLNEIAAASGIEISFPASVRVAENVTNEDLRIILLHAQMKNSVKDKVYQVLLSQGYKGLTWLRSMGSQIPAAVVSALEEVLLRS